MIKKDYYKVLQIETSAETEQIHEAYKQLAKDYQQTQSNLSDFIFKMKELNEAYLVLSNSEDREEYDETSDENDILPEIDKEEDTEDEDLEQEIPIEIDENSVKQFRLKIESFSAYFISRGEVGILGEILIPYKNEGQYLYTFFSVYESSGKLIGTGDDWIDISRKRQTFNKTIYTKPTSAIPTKIRINFNN